MLHITYLEGSESLGERLLALSDITLSALDLPGKAHRFNYHTGAKVEIRAAQPIDYVADGEPFLAKSLVISIKHNPLRSAL